MDNLFIRLENENQSYAFADINIDDKEKIIDTIQIDKTQDQFYFWGNLTNGTLLKIDNKKVFRKYIALRSASLNYELIKYLECAFSNLENKKDKKELSTKLTKLILNNIVTPCLNSVKKEYMVLNLQLQTKTNLFDIPIWHQNSHHHLFHNYNSVCFNKTLVGPGTLFKNVDCQVTKSFLNYRNQLLKENNYNPKIFLDNEHKYEMCKFLNNYDVQACKQNQIAIYRTGEKNLAIHSIPALSGLDMLTGRFDLSIYPVTLDTCLFMNKQII